MFEEASHGSFCIRHVKYNRDLQQNDKSNQEQNNHAQLVVVDSYGNESCANQKYIPYLGMKIEGFSHEFAETPTKIDKSNK